MKKFISFILTAAMIMSMSVMPITAHAAVTEESGIISLLKELNIMQGDENGDMGLDRLVSRAEFAKIAVAASPAKNTVALGLKISPYKDVPYTEWFAPYVKAAVSAGYVQGYLDATYRPNNTVTYEEAVTVMLRVLNYSDSDFGAAYPYGQIAQAQGLDMLDDVNGEIGGEMTRRQIMRLIYNTLQAAGASAQAGGQSSFSGQLLSAHECVMIEDVDIIAGSKQDSSLGSDKIFTSSGTYTKGGFFDEASVGMTGTAFVKNSRDIIAFVPDDERASDYETYFVYSMLANSVVGYNNGKFETINIPDSTTVYRDHSPTNYMAIKSGLEMGDTLYVKRTSGGSIDYITYESNTMEGPVKVTSSGWLSSIGGNSGSTVMRDGARSSASAVMTNDIIYYSAPLDMVFAYSDKVTGVYENASPTKDSPTSVTVSGKVYEVEGVDAFNNLSSSGSFNYGDTVTICLGKDGRAAGVVTSATQSASSLSGTSSSSEKVVGYVIDAGTKLFTDSSNNEYSSYYITIVSPDGVSRTYETDSNRSGFIRTVCEVSFDDGKAKITQRRYDQSVSGRVSYENGTLGDYALSPNVNILDVNTSYGQVLYKRIFAQRIDGLTLTGTRILYCERNAMNEITSLILDDVTGDVYQYGVVVSSKNGANVVDIDGTQTTISSGGKNYGGPVKIAMSSSSPGSAGIVALSSYSGSVSSLTQSTAVIGNVTYRLSADVVCYKRTASASYQKISLDNAINGKYSITAYYDKTEANGGRIRILICNE